jgi:predicted TPR repeat methyltransferase
MQAFTAPIYVSEPNDELPSFEHSLVEELGYNGYERLRRGFDRAYGGVKNVPMFMTTIDAGCGTGLVGEQVN